MDEIGKWEGQTFENIYLTNQNQTPLVTTTKQVYFGISNGCRHVPEVTAVASSENAG